MTEATVTEIVRVRYGNLRQNASSDDQVIAQRAAGLNRRKPNWTQPIFAAQKSDEKTALRYCSAGTSAGILILSTANKRT